MSRPRQLTDWQWARLRRVLALRASLADKVLAKRWGVSYMAIRYAVACIRREDKP